MSLSTNIRDYVEVLAGVNENTANPLEFEKFISESLLYVLKICQTCILQFLSFQWIRDFSLLPIRIPTFSESLVGQTPPGSLFEFLEILHLEQNPLLVGILNSVFFTLPISIIHIISIRRLLIQGIPAAAFSFGGYIAGQILFISCVIFGIQGVIIPWLTLEPLNYFAGLILIARIVFSLRFESLLALRTWHHPKYKKFFIYSFLVAWCEQGAIFQFLGNVTFSANPTILQGFTSNHLGLSIAHNLLYIIGILLGSVVFTGFWMWAFLKAKNFVLDRTMFYTTKIISDINKASYIASIAITLTTVPYYAINYLLTGPLGFVAEDEVFEATVFSHNTVPDVSPEFNLVSRGKLLELKLFPFNRGQYLVYPGDDISTFSMEELSYRSDYAWVRRIEKLSLDVVSTHIKGQRLADSLGFHRVDESQTERLLPPLSPTIIYRLELNTRLNKMDKMGDVVKILMQPSSILSNPVGTKELVDDNRIIKDFLKNELGETNIEVGSDYNYTSPGSEFEAINEEKELEKQKRRSSASSQVVKQPLELTLDRFYEWYDFEDITGDDEDRLLNTVMRNNVQGVYLFPPAFLQDELTLGERHQQISLRLKQQYNSSLIFKIFLKLDIDLLLNRQPRRYRLSGEQEYDLLVKRNILSKYYDSLRSYTKMTYSALFEEFFNGSKNIASQVYNQQFNGTIRNLTKYFSLTVDEELDLSTNKFLEYIASHDFDFLNEEGLELICQEAIYAEMHEEDEETGGEENSEIMNSNDANNDEDDDEEEDEDDEDEEDDDEDDEGDEEENNGGEDGQNVESDENFKAVEEIKAVTEVQVVESVESAGNAEGENQDDRDEDDEDDDEEEDEDDEDEEFDITEILSNQQNTGKFNYINTLEKIKRTKLVLKFDQPLYKLNKSDIGPEPHEELYNLLTNSNESGHLDIVLNDQYSLPFYAGWDGISRNLTITNKPITKKFAGSYMYVTPEFIKNTVTDTPNEYLSKRKDISPYLETQIANYAKVKSFRNEQKDNLIKFSCWPLPEDEFKILYHENPIPYVVLKEIKDQVIVKPEDEYMVELFDAVGDKGIPATREWLMENMLEIGKRDDRSLLKKFTPKKGGFIWPGNTDESIPGHERRKPKLFPDLALSENMARINANLP